MIQQSDPKLLQKRAVEIAAAQCAKSVAGHSVGDVLAHPDYDCLGRLVHIDNNIGTLRFGDDPSSPTASFPLDQLFNPRTAAAIGSALRRIAVEN